MRLKTTVFLDELQPLTRRQKRKCLIALSYSRSGHQMPTMQNVTEFNARFVYDLLKKAKKDGVKGLNRLIQMLECQLRIG